MLHRIAVATLLALVVLGHGTGDAAAAWTARGSGQARATAATLPAVAAPQASATTVLLTKTFTVTWASVTVVPGVWVTGYRITRIPSSGTAGPVTNGTCADRTTTTPEGMTSVYVPADRTATTQSCTDTTAAPFNGSVSYTVTPVYAKWLGPVSPRTGSVS